MKNLKLTIAVFILLSVSIRSIAMSQIKVVTTLMDLKSITEYIGGDRVDVFAIATGYQNPHLWTRSRVIF